MSDKLLEFVGIAAAGAAIYLVAENNIPAIKKALPPLAQAIPPQLPHLLPVSTLAPPLPGITPKGVCPPGTYEDFADGVLRCHSSHGTHELDPNVKPFNSYWQNAWGIKYVDNNTVH